MSASIHDDPRSIALGEREDHTTGVAPRRGRPNLPDGQRYQRARDRGGFAIDSQLFTLNFDLLRSQTTERAAQRLLVDRGKYTLDRPGDDWKSPAFDDAHWPTGRGAFGTAGTPGITPNTDWSTADIWLRRQITLADSGVDPAALELLVFHDEDVEIYFDGVPPPSVLQVPGARDIAVEFTSMSKTYSMAGWRIGFAAGNKTLIQALTRIKSYLDYGAFTPIQVAATAALNGPQDCIVEARDTYKERRDVLIEGLAAAGWALPAPQASMFAWALIPKEFAELGSLAFSKVLLTQANVAVSPGIGFGEHGDAHVRIALVENKHRIRQAVRNIRQVMADPGRAIDLYLRGVGDNITPIKARA